MPARALGGSLPRRMGFTMVEVLVALVISSFILVAIYKVMVTQGQLFAVQAGGGEARETLRGAASLLSAEVMELSNDGSDIYSMGNTSIVLRSSMAVGVTCFHQVQSGKRIVGLRQTAGDWATAQAGDSLLGYDPAGNTWSTYVLDASWTGTAALDAARAPRCFWGDSTTSNPRPEVAIRFPNDPTVITVGSILRRFRRVEYGTFLQNGRWWLGRRYGTSTAWELLTGPFASPANGGLIFRYLAESGSVTTDPSEVVRIEFTMRAESTGKASALAQRGGSGYVSDSITVGVSVHNVR